jgi:hypothetical protein
VKIEIRQRHPTIQVECITKNFARSFDPGFFDDIEHFIRRLEGDFGVMINNVAHRKAHFPSHDQPDADIKDTIACSTYVQVRMCQIAMKSFLKRRPLMSAMVCTTAQCQHPNFGLGLALENIISLKHCSAYESSNAFRFYHANSWYREYGHLCDWLILTPGAVITPQTRPFLSETWGAVECSVFIDHALRLLGNVQGTQCAYWKHAISGYLVNFWPFCKNKILDQTGTDLATHSMNHRGNQYDNTHPSSIEGQEQ